jgi:FkbM family methyltransferase
MQIYPASDFVTSRAFLVDGAYEPPTQAFLKHVLQPGDVYIDVGANIGTHVITASTYVGECGAVIAIEPNPDMIERLLVNMRLNRTSNVRVLQVAAGDAAGEFKLFTHPLHPGTGWLVKKEEATEAYVAKLEESFREHPEAAMLPLPGVGFAMSERQSLKLVIHDVPLAPFPTLISGYDADRAAVIKIDVEGAEMAVIRAAEFLWERESPPCAVIEYEERYHGAREEIFEFFAQRGWSLFIVSCSERGLPTYNKLAEAYVASEFENIFAVPPARLAHCTRGCLVFDYDHAAMRRQFGQA